MVVHDAQGWWQAEAGPLEPLPALAGETTADVAVVGGGYTGLWAAWFSKQLEPDADVVVVEADVCGSGPSGRNGGFANQLWLGLPELRERFGDAAALALARASREAVAGIGGWCASNDVDAWFRPGGYLQVSTTEIQDDATAGVVAACRELGEPEACVALTASEVAERCASPPFRGGAFYEGAATVQPARLAHGLRQRLLEQGVRIFEHSPARRVDASAGGVELTTPAGSVRAGSVVLAAGAWLVGLRQLNRRMTLTSSHMVVTEPVPDVLEEIGWTGGECITDSRMLLHYLRTTRDGRIAFGWGGGPVVPGARLGRRVDVNPRLAGEVGEHLRRFFPQLEGRRLEHAWGGPIDVSPIHLPMIAEMPGGRAWAAYGYTGNGVGPSRLVGRSLAGLALGHRDEHTSLPLIEPPSVRVPPEPFRYVGGAIVRAAMLRAEAAHEAGRRPGPLTSFVAGLPKRMGIHVGR